MDDRVIRNAVIRGTSLGYEHGHLVFSISLDYGDGRQAFIGPALDVPDGRCYECIKQIMAVAGVRRWEDLVGCPVRADCAYDRVHAIGHHLKVLWFNPVKVAEACKARLQ